MKSNFLRASALALALSTSLIALPSQARADDLTFPVIFKMADKNNDGMVTKQEFLDAMSKAFDMKMDKMKGDTKMVKGTMMTRDGLKSLLNDIYHGA
jgi:Ca2+-binding EF-hand superfamily protein